MKTSEFVTDISKSLSAAQGSMRAARKDSVNPHFKSSYSDLSSAWEAIRKPITDNGLSVLQDVTTNELGVSITTLIMHASGQWIEFGPLQLPVSRKEVHGFGSAITYGKRYALCAALGIVADEDDDGNEASLSQPQRSSVSIPTTAQRSLLISIAEAERLESLVVEGDLEGRQKTLNYFGAKMNPPIAQPKVFTQLDEAASEAIERALIKRAASLKTEEESDA